MKKKRVVVTGIGIVSCHGCDPKEFYDALLAGKSAVKLISRFDTEEFPSKIAATIDDFEVGDYMDKKQARRSDPFIRYTMVAGKKALESAKLDQAFLEKADKTKYGVIVGSGMGGMSTYTEGVEILLTKGTRRVSPFFVPHIITNIAGSLLAEEFDMMGPNYSISTACATANYSIIAAADHIRKGDADLMLTGGVEAAIQPMGLAGFCALKALSTRNDEPTKASRPFDINRDGFVMGEGAAVLVLESLDHALARGAPILAEYLGGGISCDAYHMTSPHPEGKGVALCIQRALEDAEVESSQVNYVNAHATATSVGDVAEIKALQKVFSDPSKIKLNATKSMIGHTLGAAGGMEAVATVMAIHTGKIHPTINLDNPEPIINFSIPTEAEDFKVEVGISNSFGFGGHNAVVVFAPYKG